MGFFSDILGIPWKLSRVFSGDLFKDVESIYTALERDSLSLEVNNLKLARLAGREAETERRRRRGGVQRRRPQGRNSKRRRHRREGRSIISGWFASGTAGMHPTAAAAAISCFSLCSIAGDAQCQIALPTPDTRTKYYFYVIYTFPPPIIFVLLQNILQNLRAGSFWGLFQRMMVRLRNRNDLIFIIAWLWPAHLINPMRYSWDDVLLLMTGIIYWLWNWL